MTEAIETEKRSDWQKFLTKHWNILALFIVAVVLAIAGAVYVFIWVTANTQSAGMVPTTLNLWTMGHIVTFILNVVFWELLLIGIPAAIGAAIGWQWWKRLPEEEKREYHLFGKRSRSSSAGGGFSFLIFVAFCIKVFVDGNWDVAISTWTFDYVVGSMVLILVWFAVIFGIPAAIGLVWWINHEMKKKP
ncbi:MAG: hypothetical protein ACE14S_08275 [Candidatus Bathyarchaeia archaeon]